MPTALVTGGSRGVGRGVATALAEAGFTVYATGRTIASAALPRSVIRIACDHLNDADTARAFAQIGDAGAGLAGDAATTGFSGSCDAGTGAVPDCCMKPNARTRARSAVLNIFPPKR